MAFKWNIDKIQEWVKENRNDVIVYETKVVGKRRLVYIKFENKTGWVEWGNIKKGFNPSFKEQKITKEEFEKRLQNKHPHIELIGELKTVKTKTKFYCSKCKKEIVTTPDNIYHSKYGCYTCSLNNRSKVTHEEFLEKVYDAVRDEYVVLSKYKTSQDVVKMKHNTSCGHEFWMRPNNFLFQKNRCPLCAIKIRGQKRRLSHEEFISQIENKYPNKYTILSKYTKRTDKIDIVYNKCGCRNTVWAYSVLSGSGCDKCAQTSRGLKRRKSKEQFKKELEEKYPNKFEVLKYSKQTEELKIKCKICDGVFYRMGADLLQNGACACCNMSSLEINTKMVLDDFEIEYLPQKTFDNLIFKKKLRFDFYLPQHNAVIEVMGRQHYSHIDYFGTYDEFLESQERDNIKLEYCKNNNIKYIEIPFDICQYANIINILKEYDIV